MQKKAVNLNLLYQEITKVGGQRTETRAQDSGLRVQGPGFRVQDSGCRVQKFRALRRPARLCLGVQGSGSRVQGSGLRVQGSGFSVQGLGFSVQCSGFRVQGLGSRVCSASPTKEPCFRVEGLRFSFRSRFQSSGLKVWGLRFRVQYSGIGV